MIGQAGQPDQEAIPYRGAQPLFISSDLVHLDVLQQWTKDDDLWVPQSDKVSFKPLILNCSAGYFVTLLRVRGAGVLSRHRHAGPVHAIVLKGRWRYLEHDWIAEEGSYAFEPAGETHTLVVPDEVSEMITWFHVTGGYTYVDPDGRAVGYEDVFTKAELARCHYEAIGLGADYIQRVVR